MLRPEARPLDWERLDKSQQTAVEQIVHLMDEAVSQIPHDRTKGKESGGTGGSFRLDDDRASRIVLLSGERGTGKTTVLLSIKRLTEKAVRDSREKLKIRVSGQVAELSRRIVWLEPIDMEPLAEPTNLLAAILTRVEAAASKWMGGSG